MLLTEEQQTKYDMYVEFRRGFVDGASYRKTQPTDLRFPDAYDEGRTEGTQAMSRVERRWAQRYNMELFILKHRTEIPMHSSPVEHEAWEMAQANFRRDMDRLLESYGFVPGTTPKSFRGVNKVIENVEF